jgi:hypothetical protein
MKSMKNPMTYSSERDTFILGNPSHMTAKLVVSVPRGATELQFVHVGDSY